MVRSPHHSPFKGCYCSTTEMIWPPCPDHHGIAHVAQWPGEAQAHQGNSCQCLLPVHIVHCDWWGVRLEQVVPKNSERMKQWPLVVWHCQCRCRALH